MAMTLTPKQEGFCLAYLETSNASEAYRQVYSPAKASAKTINEKASRLLSQGKVRTRISELQKKVEDAFIWKRQNSINALAEIARGSENASARISAVKELNSMHGYNLSSRKSITRK